MGQHKIKGTVHKRPSPTTPAKIAPESVVCEVCKKGSTWPHETDKSKHWTSPLLHVEMEHEGKKIDAWVHQHCAHKATGA